MTEPTFTGVLQIGIVVADAEATAERYRQLLGITGWNINQVDTERGLGRNFVLRGRSVPTKAKIVWAMIGGVEIELIEPQDETSTYSEFLRTRGQGVHHVMFGTPDYDGCVQRMTEGGISVLGEGELQDTRFHLFEATAALGLICEIAEGEALVPDSALG